jgi:RHS repeat-associated protein
MTGYSVGSVTASFLYDGDGKRVQATVNGVTTQFVGSHVEWQSSTSDMVRYYYTGGVRVAMRTGDDGLVWLVGDHLGSTSIAVTDTSGATERQGYKAWGETRFGSVPTKYQFTGQYKDSYLNLDWYGSRWLDPELGRFTQPDALVPNPGNPLDWDRYTYVRNNPIKYTDPSGHKACDSEFEDDCNGGFGSGWLGMSLEDLENYKIDFGLSQFGIQTKELTYKQKKDVLRAAQLSGRKLSKAIGSGVSSEKAFRDAIGPVIIIVTNTPVPKEGNCKTEGNIITCHQPPSVTNTLHEFGHVFDKHYEEMTGGLASSYVAGTDFVGSELGYECYSVECLGHTKDMDGYDFTEEPSVTIIVRQLQPII